MSWVVVAVGLPLESIAGFFSGDYPRLLFPFTFPENLEFELSLDPRMRPLPVTFSGFAYFSFPSVAKTSSNLTF